MSHYKGDENYRVYYDADIEMGSEASDEDDLGYDPKQWRTNYARWVDAHFDVLQDLYRSFRDQGQFIFGNSFLQTATICDFTRFVFDHTITTS